MKSLIRSIVSAPKKSHYDPELGIQLDLSYITPQLIVCSAPVTGLLKSFYRYPVEHFVRFLDKNHLSEDGDWHIWNFRQEGAGYSDDEVSRKVSYHQFPDHQVPTIDIMVDSVMEIDQFLSSSKSNVAVLHCKAGKGRSGTICCAYLLFDETRSKKVPTVDDINDLYTSKRMRASAGKGISIISQKRYLDYWLGLLDMPGAISDLSAIKRSNVFKYEFLGITRLVITGPQVLDLSKFTLKLQNYAKSTNCINGVDIMSVKTLKGNSAVLHDDDRIEIFFPETIDLSEKIPDIRIEVNSCCYLWFNLAIESAKKTASETGESTGCYTATWNMFDGYKGTGQKGVPLFTRVTIYWIRAT